MLAVGTKIKRRRTDITRQPAGLAPDAPRYVDARTACTLCRQGGATARNRLKADRWLRPTRRQMPGEPEAHSPRDAAPHAAPEDRKKPSERLMPCIRTFSSATSSAPCRSQGFPETHAPDRASAARQRTSQVEARYGAADVR